MGFDGGDEKEHEPISDRLFNLLNESVEAAAASSYLRN
jgi:hypothetical protein